MVSKKLLKLSSKTDTSSTHDHNHDHDHDQTLDSNLKSINKINIWWNVFHTESIKFLAKYKFAKQIVKLINSIHNNQLFSLVLFLFVAWFFSKTLLNILYYFITLDSMILALVVLQNQDVNYNSRRLCKNVILSGLIQSGVIGGIFTLCAVMFVYLEYSKFINRFIFKIIKFLFKIAGKTFPFVHTMYPQIQMLSFKESDQTVRDDDEESAESEDPNVNEDDEQICTENNYKDSSFITSDLLDLASKLLILSTDTNQDVCKKRKYKKQ